MLLDVHPAWPGVATPVPHADAAEWSRVGDVLAGGADGYQADRDAAAYLCSIAPNLADVLADTGETLGVAVERAAATGIRQWVFIGPRLPARWQPSRAARSAGVGTALVCVAADPLVASHLRALLPSMACTGTCRCDVRDADTGSGGWARTVASAVRSLNSRRPVGVVLQELETHPDQTVAAMVAALRSATPVGSVLIAAHWDGGFAPTARAMDVWNEHSAVDQRVVLRDRDRLAGLLGVPARFHGNGLLSAAGRTEDR